jgi:hypothetical protein
MKALSIQQPWADAVLTGAKRIENRTWRSDYRGNLLIHAGKRFDQDGMTFVMERYNEIGLALMRPLLSSASDRRGVLLGMVTMVDCVRAEAVAEEQASWAFGPWCFVFENPRIFREPIVYQGALGLFKVPRAVFGSVETLAIHLAAKESA